jgi:hypothetical protein
MFQCQATWIATVHGCRLKGIHIDQLDIVVVQGFALCKFFLEDLKIMINKNYHTIKAISVSDGF